MHAEQQRILDALAIPRWRPRDSVTVNTTPSIDAPVHLQNPPAAAEPWARLQAQVAACQACALHETRTQTVFGTGSQQAKLLIVGEAPGANEDRLGEPFVGRAGQLLDAMLHAIGLSRRQVYIANVLKCRPPNNRDPLATEIKQCTRYLEQQVALLQPQIILALGRYAAHYLLDTQTSLSRLRERQHRFRDTDIPLYVSYHPAYLLRSPQDKGKAYQDLLTIKRSLACADTLSSKPSPA